MKNEKQIKNEDVHILNRTHSQEYAEVCGPKGRCLARTSPWKNYLEGKTNKKHRYLTKSKRAREQERESKRESEQRP